METYNNLNLKIDIENNKSFLKEKIKDKNILVIGGAGSIGSSYIKKIFHLLGLQVVNHTPVQGKLKNLKYLEKMITYI